MVDVGRIISSHGIWSHGNVIRCRVASVTQAFLIWGFGTLENAEVWQAWNSTPRRTQNLHIFAAHRGKTWLSEGEKGVDWQRDNLSQVSPAKLSRLLILVWLVHSPVLTFYAFSMIRLGWVKFRSVKADDQVLRSSQFLLCLFVPANLFGFEGCFRASIISDVVMHPFYECICPCYFCVWCYVCHVVLTSNLPTELAASNSARTSCIVTIWAERRCITWSRRLKDCWILVSGVSSVSPPSYDVLKHSELPQSK